MSISSKIAEKLNAAKPSNLDDEKRETVKKNIKRTLVTFAVVAVPAAIVTLATAYANISAMPDEYDEETEEN